VPRRRRSRPISSCAMSDIDTPEFAIIVNDDHEFSLWPTHCKLLPGWHYAGPVGTQVQMQDLLGKQFLTTLAATYLRPETRFGDSRL
jgi:uncharacterized protein YbdZ (MbtH family)